MTTSSRKNYNIEALRGGERDDMEYVEQYGLNPELAYTPELITALADVQMRDSIDNDGKDPVEMKKKRDMIVKQQMKLAKR